MRPIQIYFEDLMQECHIDDPDEFRRLLRRNGMPSIPSKAEIDHDLANQIVKRLMGRNINWYKYKVRERDQFDEGPLKKQSTESTLTLIDNWYGKLFREEGRNLQDKDSLLGLVCSGGFLQGPDGPDFAVRLSSSINIFIGDRGAGKSTALNLLGMLSNSVSEETDVLVTRLLNLFKTTPDEIAAFARRIRKILLLYSVERCGWFFNKDHTITCFYVDLTENTFDLFVRQNQKWHPAPEFDSNLGPSMQILQQGEVVRISESRNEFFLNNILDALYVDLYKKRVEIAKEIKKVAVQADNYRRAHLDLDVRRINQFADKRSNELRTVWNDIKRGNVTDKTIQILSSYSKILANEKKQRFEPESKIYQLLQGDEADFFNLYLGRISKFLKREVTHLQRMKDRQDEMLSQQLQNQPALADLDPELLDAMIADKQELDQMEQTNQYPDKDFIIAERESDDSEDSTDRDLFLDVMKMESSHPAQKEILLAAGQIAEFLQTRLRVLYNWIDIYKRLINLDPPLTSLVKNYVKLLQDRMELILEQENKCRSITKILNRDNIEIEVFTRGGQEAISEYQAEIAKLSALNSFYEGLLHATVTMRLRELYDLADPYGTTLMQLFSRMKKLESSLGESENTFLFNPIDVQLRQGSLYRAFNQLSFGQKSGIILKMVLETTEKHVIVIDQPEDNLDASSIINMLTPTINRLSITHQVIIATHNSNLVMGLQTPNIFVFESLGENGRIKFQGSILERNAVREMLEILEGGVPSFDLRMKIYEDFINRIKGLIQDADITMIESSYRRRTIDGLRNFLQPVVSDRSLLDFMRHELKQKDILRFQKEIIEIKKQVEAEITSDPEREVLLQQLSRLLDHLDDHISRLRDSIEEIRLMDTEAKLRTINLYKLLLEIREEYLSRMSKARDIHIEIDDTLRDKEVYCDRDHLKLVFRNLLSNSFRATEKRVTSNWRANRDHDLSEIIRVHLANVSDEFFTILFVDNGCGILAEIRNKLYVERCSDQKGRDHGLGGVIIRKLLDLSGGSIYIQESNEAGNNIGTIQRILLHRGIHS